MSAKSVLIKRELDSILAQEGFRYVGYKKKGQSYWLFGRRDGEWMQYIYIIKHFRYNQIWVEIDEKRPDENPWEPAGLYLHNFRQELSFRDTIREFHDDESFVAALKEFGGWILDYFLPGIGELRKPRYRYCVTQEMEREVYMRREELAAGLLGRHGMKALREDCLIDFLASELNKHEGGSIDEFKMPLLELAALLGECLRISLKDVQWEWDCGGCGLTYGKEAGEVLYPVRIIFSAWKDGQGTIEDMYSIAFVEQRKKKKSVWKLGEDMQSFDEHEYLNRRMLELLAKPDFLPELLTESQKRRFIDRKKVGILEDLWVGWQDGYRVYRVKEGKIQILWLMRKTGTGEMWVKAMTSKREFVGIRNIREGLSPYDGVVCCHQGHGTEVPKKMERMMTQIEKEFIPMLDKEEECLLQYSLTPELEKRQFLNRKDLLEQLEGEYDIDGIKKEEMPEFVKKVLKENKGKTMDEFWETLLGLGVLLGETAIEGKEDRHWLWDKTHASCIVTSGDEVFGIDPAFALNYAWQKEKPENVDRLCEDLFGDWEWIKGSGDSGGEMAVN